LPADWARAELRLTRDGRTMRFVFVRAAPQEALQALRNEAPDARLLRVGQPLAWTALPPHTCFCVPLSDALEQAPAAGPQKVAGVPDPV
jgi:cyclic beta-1,2-glucan synthetase